MFILDNTVLSNFFTIQNIDLLSKILENNVIVPSFVRDEFYMTKRHSGITFPFPLQEIESSDFELFKRSFYASSYRGLHDGEISCIYLAAIKYVNSTILTDDKLARKYCKDFGIEVHGSVYILALGVIKNLITESCAELYLDKMKQKGLWLNENITVSAALKNIKLKK